MTNPNITITVTPEMKRRMDAMKEVNWSEVARAAFLQNLQPSAAPTGVNKVVSTLSEKKRHPYASLPDYESRSNDRRGYSSES